MPPSFPFKPRVSSFPFYFPFSIVSKTSFFFVSSIRVFSLGSAVGKALLDTGFDGGDVAPLAVTRSFFNRLFIPEEEIRFKSNHSRKGFGQISFVTELVVVDKDNGLQLRVYHAQANVPINQGGRVWRIEVMADNNVPYAGVDGAVPSFLPLLFPAFNRPLFFVRHRR